MLTASKRMLNDSSETYQSKNAIQNSTNQMTRYETIVIGDAFCGKSTYLNKLADLEIRSNLPVMISQDKTEFEFWVERNHKKAIFKIKDTANLERFRSLTQSFYRKAQCVLLIFDVKNIESFQNLDKWYTDVMSYCKKQDEKFAIILVGLDRKIRTQTSPSINLELIEKFQLNHQYIINYVIVDLNEASSLKEPLELLLEHFLNLKDSRILSIDYFNNYSSNTKNESLIRIDNSKSKKKCCLIN